MKKNDSKCENCWVHTMHAQLGKIHTPNLSHTATKFCGENVCYKVKYDYNEFGHRILSNKKEKFNQHILLFGGSFSFGSGLNAHQTWAYKLQKKINARIYNLAISGSGPAYMLRILEETDVNLTEKKGIALYYFPWFHTERVTMSFQSWRWDTPAYEINRRGEIVSIGSTSDINKLHSILIKFLFKIKSYSNFLKLINFQYHALSYRERLELTAQIIKRSKELYEAKYGGQFYVVTHPSSIYDEVLLNRFNELSIKVIFIKNSKLDKSERRVCSCDPHPSEKYADYISDQLYEELIKIQGVFD